MDTSIPPSIPLPPSPLPSMPPGSVSRWIRKMNRETVEISKVIQKSPEDRTKTELDRILPYLATRSQLLNKLKTEVLFELIKHCRHLKCRRNDVIIRQGTTGDCFYIILTGQTSVYIDSSKNDDVSDEGGASEKKNDLESLFEELDELFGGKQKAKESPEKKNEQVQRSTLGKFIMMIESGESFGEVALLSDNAERNASIVADMDGMELLVVDRELYSRTVKEKQLAEYQCKRAFISTHPLFKHWGSRMQRLLEMSITKQSYSFNNTVVKQGQPYDGLYFLISGQAKVMMDTSRHPSQYPRLMNQVNSAKHRTLAQTMVHVKRNFGYVEAEKLANQKHIEMALLTVGDVFGGLEAAVQLPTYMATLQCVTETVVLHINAKNYDRLVVKKNPKTHEQLRETTFNHYTDILRHRATRPLPLIQAVYNKHIHLQDSEPVDQTCKVKFKDKTDKELRTAYLLQLYAEGKMQLFEPWVPDSVYFRHKSIERRKQSLSARDRILKEQRDNSVNGKLRSLHEMRKKVLSGNGRRARSRRELANVTLDEFIATQKVMSKYTEYRSKEDTAADKREELPHHANPVSVSPSTIKTSHNPSRRSSAKPYVQINDSPLLHEEKSGNTATTAVDQNLILNSDTLPDNPPNTQQPNYDMGAKFPVRPMTAVQSAPTEHTNQSLLLDEDILRNALGDNSLVAFFNVMEAMSRRRQMKKYKSRPVSAPNITTNDDSIDSDEDIRGGDNFEYVDKESSHEVLLSLEQRVSNFHKKMLQNKSDDKVRVADMKRCNIQRLSPPVAGGTVFVRLRPCSSKPSDGDDLSDHHNHVRRYILPKLNTFQPNQ